MPHFKGKTSVPENLSRQCPSREGSRSLYSTPSSRSSSRGSSGHSGLRSNVYSQFNTSSDRLRRTPAATGRTSQSSEVRRWDGTRRTTTSWDYLRKVRNPYQSCNTPIWQNVQLISVERLGSRAMVPWWRLPGALLRTRTVKKRTIASVVACRY